MSNDRGILFHEDTRSDEGAASYARFDEKGGIEVLVGTKKQLVAQYKKDSKNSLGAFSLFLIVVVLLVPTLAAIVAALNGADPWTVAGMVAFALVGSFPLSSLFSLVLEAKAFRTETCQQSRRNHGAEHIVMNYSYPWRSAARKARQSDGDFPQPLSWDLMDVGAASYIDSECGTVYMSSLLIIAVVLGLCVANLPSLGFPKLLLIVLACTAALLLNILKNKKLNPLLLFQRVNACQPTERELRLAVAGMRSVLTEMGYLPRD